jgi:hypothetical protein
MIRPQKKDCNKLAALVLVCCGWLYEIYISSGWQNGLYLGEGTSNPISRDKNSLQWLLSEQAANNRENSVKGDCKPRNSSAVNGTLSIWFAPYRRFPEVPSEGGSRGYGDYEYLRYLPKESCVQIRTNYGAFKGSKADKKFTRQTKRGLGAELQYAKRKGFDIFILDGDKSWVHPKVLDLCMQDKACKITHDGFFVIYPKQSSLIGSYVHLLQKHERFGWMAEVDRMKLLNNKLEAGGALAKNESWSVLEQSNDGSYLYTSTRLGKGKSSITLPTANSGELPINIKITLALNGISPKDRIRLTCKETTFLLPTGSIDSAKQISIPIDQIIRSCKQGPATLLLDGSPERKRDANVELRYYIVNDFGRLIVPS